MILLGSQIERRISESFASRTSLQRTNTGSIGLLVVAFDTTAKVATQNTFISSSQYTTAKCGIFAVIRVTCGTIGGAIFIAGSARSFNAILTGTVVWHTR
jgi:hypothetical protein